MKTLLTKMSLTLALGLLATPMLGHASIRITNNLDQPLKFAVYQGDVIIGRSDYMGGHMNYDVQVNPRLELSAAIKINNQMSTSRSYIVDLNRSADYNAVIHVVGGKSEFGLEQNEATALGALSLNNNLTQEVLFTVRANNEDLQKIVIPAYSQKQLSLERKYKIVIVANGVTLDPIITTNPNLTVTINVSRDQNGSEVYTAKY